jgi:hypothetical protein
MPTRDWWNAEFRKKYTADAIIRDPRPGANPDDFSWVGDHAQIGAFWRGFETLWLPTALVQPDQQRRIADALYGANRHWGFEIQFDKGLAGAPDDAIVTSRETATNPAVLTAFCLALIGSYGPPAYPGSRVVPEAFGSDVRRFDQRQLSVSAVDRSQEAALVSCG